MKKIVLPKWAVVNTMGGRLIHIGNGEFVSADAQTPRVLETALPNLSNAGDIVSQLKAEHAPYYAELSWQLGSIPVVIPEEPQEEPKGKAEATKSE